MLLPCAILPNLSPATVTAATAGTVIVACCASIVCICRGCARRRRRYVRLSVVPYRGDDPTCTPHDYSAGQSFIDAGGDDVHMLRDNTATAAETANAAADMV